MKPVTASVIITNSLSIWNDFLGTAFISASKDKSYNSDGDFYVYRPI